MKKLFVIFIFLFPWFADAAGYLEFDTEGNPYKWDATSSIDYMLDGGNLGIIPKAGVNGADDLVSQAFSVWSSAPGATLTFNDAGDTADITTANLTTYINFDATSCPTPDFVVVYDSDGSIFTELFGSAVAAGILGLATPSQINTSTKKITCGYALLNGDLATNINTVKYTLMHEFGHAQNLEHPQINGDLATNGIDSDDQYIPLMYAYIPGSLTDAFSGGLNGLKLDDQFSLLYLYNQAILNTEGRIKGQILDKKGDGVFGVNVICTDKANPRENAVSWISDSDLDGQGEYVCGHLPAGDYNVKIESVTNPINVWTDVPPMVPTEYYNGSNESFSSETDSLTEKTDVAVPATSTVNSIDLITNNNGMITSGITVSGTVEAASAAELEYHIYVPRSATKVTFNLEGTPSAGDIDLYGKCDQSFSLASTVGSFYDPTSSDQQAEFAGAGSDGSEEIILDSSSTPEIDNCEYQLVIQNYEASAIDFNLTATIEGSTPKLKADFQPKNILQDNGETVVSEVVFEAADDQFTINSITFTDMGISGLDSVTSASIYFDSNENGTVDDEDTLIATTASIDATSRKMTFDEMNIFIDEGQQKEFLITYQLPATSSSFPLCMLILGAVISAIFIRSKKASSALFILLFVFIFNRCSGSSSSEFDPRIESDTDITAVASGFGAQFSLDVGKPSSVKEFFE